MFVSITVAEQSLTKNGNERKVPIRRADDPAGTDYYQYKD